MHTPDRYVVASFLEPFPMLMDENHCEIRREREKKKRKL